MVSCVSAICLSRAWCAAMISRTLSQRTISQSSTTCAASEDDKAEEEKEDKEGNEDEDEDDEDADVELVDSDNCEEAGEEGVDEDSVDGGEKNVNSRGTVVLIGVGVAEDNGVPCRLLCGEDHEELLVLAALDDGVDVKGEVTVGEDTVAIGSSSDFSCRFCGVVREALPCASSTLKLAS